MINYNVRNIIYTKFWRNKFFKVLGEYSKIIKHQFYTDIHVITKKMDEEKYLEFFYRRLMFSDDVVEFRHIVYGCGRRQYKVLIKKDII